MATSPSSDPTVILSYARTPMGSFQGSLAAVTGSSLKALRQEDPCERIRYGVFVIDDQCTELFHFVPAREPENMGLAGVHVCPDVKRDARFRKADASIDRISVQSTEDARRTEQN